MHVEASDELELRAARNQSMFRQINERLTRDDPLSEITGGHVIACECADHGCVQMLAISHAQYEAVRREPQHFAVLPGHVYSDVEFIVSGHKGFVVVEQLGRTARAAEASDPHAQR